MATVTTIQTGPTSFAHLNDDGTAQPLDAAKQPVGEPRPLTAADIQLEVAQARIAELEAEQS